jgi:putative ABC transport system permease protein
MATDEHQGFIVNEALVRRMGWGNDALGKRMESAVLSTPDGNSISGSGKVIGVVRDFNLGSLHSPVSPLMIALSTPPHRYRWAGTVVNMRIADGKIDEATRFIEEKRREFGIQTPVQFAFLEQMLNQFYQAEERMSTIFGYGATVCIVLSFLGLLGLASLMTERRTKEIGIRKVLGASVTQLVALLSEHFVQLAIIANLLAWPVAYYGVSKWLQDYPYRIDIGVAAFIVSGVLAISVTLLAVGFQAYKVASGDPILSLKTE